MKLEMVKKLCRLCAKEKDNGINIYQEEGIKQNLSNKMSQCLQIRVYPDDQLPKMVCLDCCIKLNHSAEFFETTSKAQRILKKTFGLQKRLAAESFSQLENTEDAKHFVECVLLGTANESESNGAQKRNCEEPKDVTKVKKRNKNNLKKQLAISENNEGHASDSGGGRDDTEAETKQQRVRLEVAYTWQCTDCPSILTTLQELKEHHNTVHDQSERYQCIECAKVYTVYKKFTRHVRLHRDHGKYKCRECGKSFSSKQAMDSHAVIHSEARPHCCPDCGKSFRQRNSLYSHRRLHQADQSGFSCEDCGKTVLSLQSLERHKRSHAGARDYTCDICGKGFAVKQGLVYHMMSHSGERPHCCQHCGKRCKTIHLLNKHMAIHSDLKTHQCEVCGKQFREKSTLKLHTRIHTGAMPYKCEFCGRQFRFQGVYVIHRRQHTGERPYKCSDCKRDFTNWANYNKHLKCHHAASDTGATNQTLSEELNVSALPEKLSVSCKNTTKPPPLHIACDYSDPSVPLEKMMGPLCPLQDSHKTNLVESIPGHQLYSQSTASNLPSYYFPSNTNQQFSGFQ